MVFTAGAVLTAAQLNALGAWSAWTPTVTATAGTFTTVSAAGRYAEVGKTVHWSATITITTVGTASGGVIFTLPVTSGPSSNLGSGRANGSGKGVTVVSQSTTQGVIYLYDFTSAIAVQSIFVSGTYEAA